MANSKTKIRDPKELSTDKSQTINYKLIHFPSCSFYTILRKIVLGVPAFRVAYTRD